MKAPVWFFKPFGDFSVRKSLKQTNKQTKQTMGNFTGDNCSIWKMTLYARHTLESMGGSREIKEKSQKGGVQRIFSIKGVFLNKKSVTKI